MYKELVIFNTAPEPLELDDYLRDLDIIVINQPNAHTENSIIPYSSLGKIREDALRFATGEIYVCWDDDDMFLPWHLSQGMDNLGNKPAWMPAQSYFSNNGGKTYELCRNSFEASVLVRIDALEEYGFSYESGAEHLPWRRGMVDSGELSERDEVTPLESYAYLWGDDLAPHKTSGNIDHPDNFNNHKEGSTDFGGGKTLKLWDAKDIEEYFKNVYESVRHPKLKAKMNHYLVDKIA